MADTSPFPEKPKHEVPGAHKLSDHKKLLVVIAVIVVIGLLAMLYGAYSSRRNTLDGSTTDGVTQKTDVPGQVSSANQPDNTAQSKTQTVPEFSATTEANQTITLKLYADSGTELVNTVQAVVNYPKSNLQLVSVDGTGSAFSNEVATDKSTAGVIKLARTVTNQAASVRGQQLVATLTFKTLNKVDASKQVTVDTDDSYLVTSSDNRNLLASGAGTLTLR